MKIKCKVCKEGDFDFSMSEISLTKTSPPLKAEIEGICNNCGSYIIIHFTSTKAEITEFDDLMEEKKKYEIEI